MIKYAPIRLLAVAIALFACPAAYAQIAKGAAGFGKLQLNDVRSIEGEFKQRDLSFDEVSAGGWKVLGKADKEAFLKQLREVQSEKDTGSVRELTKKLSDVSARVDLQAFKALAEKGVFDKNMLKLYGIDADTPATTVLTDREARAVDWYRKFQPRWETDPPRPTIDFQEEGVRKGPPKFGCGSDCAVVGAGSPAPGVPGQPLVPHRPGDLTRLQAKGRRPDAFNPIGFLEVVLIEYDIPGSCTGTLLSPTVVLTAAHCVDGRKAAQLKLRLPVYSEETRARCSKLLTESARYEQCVEFVSGTASRIAIHDKFKSGTMENDVAYIVLANPHTEGSYARIRFMDDVPARITMAGYGENNLSDKRTLKMLYALEVGWHEGNSVESKGGKIGWLRTTTDGQSATCSGDSGGPIYADHYDGGTDAKNHALFAVTSSGNSSDCEKYYVRQTKLGAAEVRRWMCTELKDVVSECGKG